MSKCQRPVTNFPRIPPDISRDASAARPERRAAADPTCRGRPASRREGRGAPPETRSYALWVLSHSFWPVLRMPLRAGSGQTGRATNDARAGRSPPRCGRDSAASVPERGPQAAIPARPPAFVRARKPVPRRFPEPNGCLAELGAATRGALRSPPSRTSPSRTPPPERPLPRAALQRPAGRAGRNWGYRAAPPRARAKSATLPPAA